METIKFASLHGTGVSAPVTNDVDYPFDKYIIRVRLGSANEFLGVVSISVSTDFRSQQQKIASSGYHDVTDLYDD